MEKSRQESIQGKIKRACDLFASIIFLIILSPLFLFSTLLILVTMGRPVLFKHKRPGFREKIFTIYKFRTMDERRDENGKLLPDEERITKTGKLLRSLSLDELPQLFNVIKGDLSLVGPRPLLVQYLERYEPWQRRRHLVKPGITGWAQVNGRNAISWEDKFRYDIYYVDNWSLWFDLKILFLTIWKVLKREGISQEGRATMEEFMGKQNTAQERRE